MITVTGATGQLGRLVVAALLDRGVPAGEIVAVVRNPEKAADLKARGVQVREADYCRSETLPAALAGTEKLLLISGSALGKRVPQHANVINAAAVAGVSLIAYTSILNADTTRIQLASEHQATEGLIRESGLPFVFLRNGWYTENYTADLAGVLERGMIVGAAGEGRVAVATRADYAEAAAAVLTGDGHSGRAYELGGDHACTLPELAAELSACSGRPVVYRNLFFDEYVAMLTGAGLSEPIARILADSDLGIARGDLDTGSGHLRTLIGRPTTGLTEALTAAVKAA